MVLARLVYLYFRFVKYDRKTMKKSFLYKLSLEHKQSIINGELTTWVSMAAI